MTSALSCLLVTVGPKRDLSLPIQSMGKVPGDTGKPIAEYSPTSGGWGGFWELVRMQVVYSWALGYTATVSSPLFLLPFSLSLSCSCILAHTHSHPITPLQSFCKCPMATLLVTDGKGRMKTPQINTVCNPFLTWAVAQRWDYPMRNTAAAPRSCRLEGRSVFGCVCKMICVNGSAFWVTEVTKS